ncbi:unnamed protein product [Effrenium voratum]|nr:unnamed protein product [Effrenium voratum]
MADAEDEEAGVGQEYLNLTQKITLFEQIVKTKSQEAEKVMKAKSEAEKVEKPEKAAQSVIDDYPAANPEPEDYSDQQCSKGCCLEAGDISELHNTSSAARLAMHSPLKLAPEKGKYLTTPSTALSSSLSCRSFFGPGSPLGDDRFHVGGSVRRDIPNAQLWISECLFRAELAKSARYELPLRHWSGLRC